MMQCLHPIISTGSVFEKDTCTTYHESRQLDLVAEAVEDDLRHVVTMLFEASDLLQKVKTLTGNKA